MKKINRDKLNELICSHAEERMAKNQLGGAELMVRQEGEIVFHKTFGVQHTGDKEPLKENCLYRTASMTKPVSTVALLREVDQGHIDLYAPVTKYIPEIGKMHVAHVEDNKLVDDGQYEGVIRVFNLVNHTSGIDAAPVSPLEKVEWNGNFEAVVKHTVNNTHLAFQPYTSQMYSSHAFCVACRIVELVSGMDYKEYLKKYITEPLEMPDTTYEISPEQAERMISMHYIDKDGKSGDRDILPDRLFELLEPGQPRGGFGLASTCSDYSKFAQMLLNGGVGDNGARILSEESVRKMQMPTVPEFIMPGDQKWGLGVRVITYPTYPWLDVGSYGWSGAYGTHFWVDPQNKITAVYMKNDGTDGGAGCSTGNQFESDVHDSLEG